MKINLGRETLTCGRIAQICRGTLTPGGQEGIRVSSVCTDSREAGPGSAFLAIKGERTDGHLYAGAAAAAGAACVIGEYRPENAPDIPFILTDSTVGALQRLAGAYFCPDGITRIAVTGSVGKTTTKEMIYSVLSARPSFRSEGNFNSVIGMPMTMLSIPGGTRYAVLELGLERLGDISVMSRLWRPDIAVITNVGSSHLEYAGSRERLIAEKVSVADGMDAGGKILVGKGSAGLEEALAGDGRVMTFSEDPLSGADFYPVGAVDGAGEQRFSVVCPGHIVENCVIGYYGWHNLRAAVSAAAVGFLSGLSDREILEGLANYRTVGLRQKIEKVAGVTLINDCYNASPESMRTSCETLLRVARDTGGRRFAFLADMFELGPRSPELHAEVGEYFARSGVDYIITFGAGAVKYAEGAKKLMPDGHILEFPDPSDPVAPAAVAAALLAPGDVITVKGSRGMRAERFSEALTRILRRREDRGGEEAE
ncbi:MAG: UDP-N-acetylmuramoyl-tripeptide--D-alanyl-D-alanine ligase [Clostridia bacterium]|nr:UDP-N-acetylmuramoyl-tripeptide--D-alanyl-D-alanine ligase [Clostridia bacterium]